MIDPDPGPSGAEATDASHAADEPRSFPWPPAGGDDIIEAWGRTWHGASLEPRRFFASMSREGTFGAALLYYLSIGIPVAGAQLFWSMVLGTRDDITGSNASALAAGAPLNPLLEFLFSPLILLLSLFVAAGVTHLLLKLFGGTRAGGDYGTTSCVFAYSYSPQILGVIPMVGGYIGFVWMVVIAIIGLREAHRTTMGRAAAAVIVPVLMGLAFVAFAALLVRAGGLLDV